MHPENTAVFNKGTRVFENILVLLQDIVTLTPLLSEGAARTTEVKAPYSCYNVMIMITKSNCRNENAKG